MDIEDRLNAETFRIRYGQLADAENERNISGKVNE
jgi:hypothetical protein